MPLEWLATGTVTGGGPFGNGPDTISDLELWLDANQIAGLSNGDEISTWADSSGNSRDATGFVINLIKPKYRATDGPNSMPAVRMHDSGGVGGAFNLPNFLTGFSAGHGFAIVQIDTDPPPSGGAVAPVFGDFGSAGDEYFPYWGDSKIYDAFGSNTRHTTADPVPSLATWRLYENRTASGAWSNWLDGTMLFSTASNTVAWGTAPRIGYSVTNTKQLKGLVAECFMYSRILTSGEIATLKAYITAKYGLTLV